MGTPYINGKVELEDDIARIRIVSSNEWRTKTKKTRVLELHKKAIKILEQRKGIHPNFVFSSKNNHENLNKINGEYKGNDLVAEVISFISKDKKRPICTPNPE